MKNTLTSCVMLLLVALSVPILALEGSEIEVFIPEKYVDSTRVGPDNSLLIVSHDENGPVRLRKVDLGSGAVKTIPLPAVFSEPRVSVRAVEASPEGSLVAVVNFPDRSILVKFTETGEVVASRTAPASEAGLSSFTVSSDGSIYLIERRVVEHLAAAKAGLPYVDEVWLYGPDLQRRRRLMGDLAVSRIPTCLVAAGNLVLFHHPASRRIYRLQGGRLVGETPFEEDQAIVTYMNPALVSWFKSWEGKEGLEYAMYVGRFDRQVRRELKGLVVGERNGRLILFQRDENHPERARVSFIPAQM
jgi:hypothetical protein